MPVIGENWTATEGTISDKAGAARTIFPKAVTAVPSGRKAKTGHESITHAVVAIQRQM